MSKLELDLGWSFFALSTEYKQILLNNILFLIKNGFSYTEILNMPIYIRRYFLELLTKKE